MKIFFVFLILSSFILAQSSSIKNNGHKKEDNQLIPLKIGNCWYNERISFADDDSITSIEQDSMYVKKDTTINSLHGYFFSTYLNSAFYQDSVGLWVHIINTKENYLFRYPCKVNDSWEVSIADMKGSVIVKSLNAFIEIKEKSYKCIHYEISDNNTQYGDIFIQPTIGFVKVILYKNNHKNMEVRLINFNIK